MKDPNHGKNNKAISSGNLPCLLCDSSESQAWRMVEDGDTIAMARFYDSSECSPLPFKSNMMLPLCGSSVSTSADV